MLTLARFLEIQPGLTVNAALFTAFAKAAETWRIAETTGQTGLSATQLELAESCYILHRDRLADAAKARRKIGKVQLQNRGTVETPAALAAELENESNKWLTDAQNYLNSATTPPTMPSAFPGVAR